MGTHEDRQKVLQMLAKGTITVEEADQLLSAMNPGNSTNESEATKSDLVTSSSVAHKVTAVPKYLRVVVEPKAGHGDRVNVRVPFQLLRAGAKLAAFMPKEARVQVEGKLNEHGLNFDLAHLSADNLDELVQYLSEMTVDVDTENESVRVFCE